MTYAIQHESGKYYSEGYGVSNANGPVGIKFTEHRFHIAYWTCRKGARYMADLLKQQGHNVKVVSI